MTSENTRDPAASGIGRASLRLFAPVIIFATLALMFAFMLLSDRNQSEIPSALIGAGAPDHTLPALEGLNNEQGKAIPGLSDESLKKGLFLVNFWGSWCIPCRQEHPHLMTLSQDPRVQLVGINYKDLPGNALRFLGTFGNPYDIVGVDTRGRELIGWGGYGVPETFLVADGRILFKYIGPITVDGLKNRLMPEIDKAVAAQNEQVNSPG